MSRKLIGSMATAALGLAIAGYLGVAHSQASPSPTPSGSASPGATPGAGSSYFLNTSGYATDGSTSPTDTPGSASLIGPVTIGSGGAVTGTVTLTYANVGGMDSCPLTVQSGSTISDNGNGTATLVLNVGGANPMEFTVLDSASAPGGSSSASTTSSGGTTAGTTKARKRRAGASPTASATPGVIGSLVDLMVVQTATTSSGALGIPCGGTAGPIIATLLRGDMTCRPSTTTSCALSLAPASGASPSPSASPTGSPAASPTM